MTASVKLFLPQISRRKDSLDGTFHPNHHRYPDGQIDLPPEPPIELPSESPECCGPPDRTLVPYLFPQKLAESRPAPWHLTTHSLQTAKSATLKMAPPKIVQYPHNRGWHFELRKRKSQARTCSKTLAFRRILRTVSVG